MAENPGTYQVGLVHANRSAAINAWGLEYDPVAGTLSLAEVTAGAVHTFAPLVYRLAVLGA